MLNNVPPHGRDQYTRREREQEKPHRAPPDKAEHMRRKFYEGVDRDDPEALLHAPVAPYPPMACPARRGSTPTAVELDIEQARLVNLDMLESSSLTWECNMDTLYLYRSLSMVSAARHTDYVLRTFHEQNIQEFEQKLVKAQQERQKERFKAEVSAFNRPIPIAPTPVPAPAYPIFQPPQSPQPHSHTKMAGVASWVVPPDSLANAPPPPQYHPHPLGNVLLHVAYPPSDPSAPPPSQVQQYGSGIVPNNFHYASYTHEGHPQLSQREHLYRPENAQPRHGPSRAVPPDIRYPRGFGYGSAYGPGSFHTPGQGPSITSVHAPNHAPHQPDHSEAFGPRPSHDSASEWQGAPVRGHSIVPQFPHEASIDPPNYTSVQGPDISSFPKPYGALSSAHRDMPDHAPHELSHNLYIAASRSQKSGATDGARPDNLDNPLAASDNGVSFDIGPAFPDNYDRFFGDRLTSGTNDGSPFPPASASELSEGDVFSDLHMDGFSPFPPEMAFLMWSDNTLANTKEFPEAPTSRPAEARASTSSTALESDNAAGSALRNS
ncbi:hypothetical protein DICSQDRAFT_129573 [Dichomitus squalens LYAD-421 SS1]|uniref:Uncharacterized protein n=2 Tax=Dichomitus squalens TaxID=114155 RepID=A0A4Q9PJ60_9APHY|nr:uncharacterized protein DICSQDRAFT_129573 [Dichomitus squalens LYAD-421 SS1]EJF57244.1 hypothetical protein DICSQDRAFT_129573 [Dichomitus squalens LYAD-421 SS1]TBU54120.1 hypothetical protein BD310DRAFT_961662 [Dichomitus squalens]